MGSGSIAYIVRVLMIQSSWTCANYVSLFFICSLSFLIKKKKKKLQKRERTCRAYMKVLEQCFCPLCLLPPPPLFLCYCVGPSPSSAACTLCTVMYSLLSALPFFFFFFNCLTHRHSRTQSAFSKSKRSHLKLLRWLLYGCVCVFSPSLYSLTVVYFVVLSGVPYCVCFL